MFNDHTNEIWDEPEHKLDKSDIFGGGFQIEHHSQGPLSTAYGMYMRGDLLSKIGKTLLDGNSIRKTSRECKVSKNTVKKLHNILCDLGFKVLCPCGNWIGHQGWCKYRFEKSTKRQEFLRTWHPNFKIAKGY